jgi:hypothetical protein
MLQVDHAQEEEEDDDCRPSPLDPSSALRAARSASVQLKQERDGAPRDRGDRRPPTKRASFAVE